MTCMHGVSGLTVGMDEVGRGSWAGPLVAGAVALARPIDGVKDSKQLNRIQRERLDGVIRDQAVAYGLGWVAAEEIDMLGMTASVRLAFARALAAIPEQYAHIIIDGNYNYFPQDPRVSVVVRGDSLIPAVSAASIIAKVARDSFMRGAAAAYPAYGFESHVGYGTARHRRALQEYGVCPLHRRSFRPVRMVAG